MGVPDDDRHVDELLGSYVLGRLSAAEETIVEQHLRCCASCYTECQYLGTVHGYLAMLTGDDVQELLVDLDKERKKAASDVPIVSRSGWVVGPAVGPVYHGRPRRGYWRVILAAAAVALVLGLGVGTWIRGPAPAQPPAVDLVATATDRGTGVSATLVLTPLPNEIAMQATMDGLSPGIPHRLFLITREGQPVEVVKWTSGPDSQMLSVTIATRIDDVELFAIATPDGSVVLLVPFGQGGTLSPPPLPAS